MKDPLGVSPSKGNQGATRGKEKILILKNLISLRRDSPPNRPRLSLSDLVAQSAE